MSNIHPLIVHFPIALIIVVFILDLLGAVGRRQPLISAANIVAIFAALGAAGAVVTGLIAEESVWHTEEAHELIELHETIGFAVLGAALFSLIFRPAIKKKKTTNPLVWVAVFISMIAAVLVGYGAYLGGEIVYRHGTGVKEAETATARADSLARLLEEYNLRESNIEGDNQHQH